MNKLAHETPASGLGSRQTRLDIIIVQGAVNLTLSLAAG